MQPAPIPADEALRQRALDDMELLDTPAELYLDTLVRLTRELFQVETALISLVDRERQWFKARIGLEMGETPRDISFCGHAVAARQPLLVEDALLDPRFADNPAVTGPPFIRFYAGQPLFSQDQAIGTLCLLHPQPRSLSQQERSRLRDLAILVEGYLQLRSMGYETRRLRQAVDREQRKALIDPLTQLWNRAALNQFFEREMARAQDAGLRLGAIYIDLDHFKKVNDTYGHPMGDRVIKSLALFLKQRLRKTDHIGRYGGEEFAVVLPDTDAVTAAKVLDEIRRRFAEIHYPAQPHDLSCTFSCGIAELRDDMDGNALSKQADEALYVAKRGGRNRVEIYLDEA